MKYQVLSALASGVFAGLIVWGMERKDVRKEKELKEIHWTPCAIENWVNPSLSNKPTYHIMLGIRRDGMVVWKEVIQDEQRESRVEFETPDGKDQEVIISHVGAVKYLPPKK